MTKPAGLLAVERVSPAGSSPRGKVVLGRATHNRARIRVLMVVACLLAGPGVTGSGQVRFTDPSEGVSQTDLQPVRQNPFRRSPGLQQVQFEQIPPQIPAAADEAAAPGVGRSDSTSSGRTTVAPEPLPPGVMTYDYDPLTLSAPDGTQYYDGEFMGAPLEEALADDGTAVIQSTNEWFRRGYWYTQQDIVVMLRSDVKNITITANSAAITSDPPRITSKTVTPTYAPGTRLTLGRFLGQDKANRDYTVEVGFLGLFDYTERAELQGALKTALGPTNEFKYILDGTNAGAGSWIVIGDDVPAFSSITNFLQQDVLYSSDLNSLEVNLRVLGRPLRDRITLQPNGRWVRHGTPSHLLTGLIGLRGMSLNELFRYQSNSLDGELENGIYQVQTRNDMFGIHVGVDLSENYANWSWGGRFKAGSLYNFADRRSRLAWRVDVPGFESEFSNVENLDKENLAIVLEGGVMATYQLRPNFSARIAYDAMYVTGVAIATDNLRIDSTFPTFKTTSDAIFHGMSVGFEMLW